MNLKQLLVSISLLLTVQAFAQKPLSLSVGTLPSLNYSSVRVKATTIYNITGQIGTVHKGPVSHFWTGTDEHVFATLGIQTPTLSRFTLGSSLGCIMNIRTNWTLDSPRMIIISDIDYLAFSSDKNSWKIGTTIHNIIKDRTYILPTITYTHLL